MKSTLCLGLLSITLSLFSSALLAEENVCLANIQDHLYQIGPDSFELNLDHCNLKDSDMKKVADIFKTYRGITEFDLNYNNISKKGIEFLGDLENVQIIGIDSNHLGDEGLQAIINRTKNLGELSANKNNLTNQSITILANTKIRLLSLGNNQITDASSLADRYALNLNENPLTADSILKLANSKTLNILYISGSHPNKACLEALRDNTELADLDISKTNIGDTGIKILADNTRIGILAVRGNQISSEGIQHGLAKMKDLYRLYINDNNIGPIGVSALPGNLQLLDLSNCNLGDEGVQKLQGQKIQYLFLNDDHIKTTKTATYLIETFPSLISLSINNNQLGTAGAKELAKKHFDTIDIINNNIGNEGALALTEAVTYGLSFANNGIDDKGINALERKLSPDLYYLDVRKNPITAVSIQLLKKHQPPIRYLYVDDILNNKINTSQTKGHFLDAIDQLCSHANKYQICKYQRKIHLPH